MSEKLKMLTAEEILGADDKPVSDPIPCPEWGGYVRVRTLSGEERDAFELKNTIQGEHEKYGFLRNMRADMVALCACDDDGKPLFTRAQVAALGKKSCIALNRVFDVARKQNGWTKEDVKEMEKNSGDVPSEGTGSA